jgi:hypothetical protein
MTTSVTSDRINPGAATPRPESDLDDLDRCR